mmetsp:Transcript_45/g.69  ORF Transcript_45/g.69 Transcript_45/m.69 type:complete len:364 (-) Transcript_45:1818-2909(-)|eukprot:CAMPEP_0195299426 /NCGR_PEP_ID=MMETSP0707-20130614/25523_1 /TAXON_ID=33640 /ORGANISM="Asterionellopsis glacialis, Strain CCMP134" /LENGTH=363 /DNA_ID=CAMNT_0040361833 /DNA_START=93 /DNA_END=1184 /DNA_ORIENTATION=+
MNRCLQTPVMLSLIYMSFSSMHFSEAFVHIKDRSIQGRSFPDSAYNVQSHCTPFTQLSLSSSDESLAFWITSFSTSHIGMSAIRSQLIEKIGKGADSLGLVGNTNWKLPDFWPGDAVGGNSVLPDADTAGRQLYRMGYTTLSFLTLGNALLCYLQSTIGASQLSTGTLSTSSFPQILGGGDPYMLFYLFTAVAANTAALASLTNASPLGLMPEFTTTNTESSLASLPTVERDDNLKFDVKGLTRITRHPLILPVVPWGVSNAMLLGGRTADWLFFGGLAIYAALGCAAQDMRVIRQEGSVGTVFRPGQELQMFFKSTSFVPFAAVFQGKQSMKDIAKEFPAFAFCAAAPLGFAIERTMLDWLR